MRPLGVNLILPRDGRVHEACSTRIPSLPRIEDGACLQWLLFSTGATTNASPFTSRVDVGWG